MQDLASQQRWNSLEPAPIHRRAGSEPFASFAASTRTAACRADDYASPGLADAWAKAIIRSWRTARAAGRLDPDQPLYVLDLAPGSGHFARLLLHALRHHLADTGISSFPSAVHEVSESWTVRYLACTTPGCDAIELDDDRFDTVLWSPLDNSGPPPSSRCAFHWHETGNPLVVLALDYLQAFPGQLRAVHYGQWMEGRVHVASECENHCELAYDWQAIADDEPYCPATLRQRYLRTLSNSCVLVPDAGLRTLQRIAELTHGRFLWLAVDQGAVDERQLRFGAMSPPATWSYEAQHVPVNFHALAYEQAARGAWSWHGQQHEHGMVVQAVWRHDGIPVTQGDCSAMAGHLQCFQPDDATQLETLASALAPESAPSLHLALLRSAHHDPRVLRATLAAWLENPPELTDAERSHWGSVIAHAWRVCPKGGDEADLRYSMAVFAVQVGRLDIARNMFKHDGNSVCIAMCYSLGGRIDLALSCLEALADSSADALRTDLRQRLARWQALGWYHTEGSHDGELCLVPLDEGHAQELYEQYRDPQIGELTRLPDLDTPEAARAWIAEQTQEAGRATYALMHVDIGLIGVVSAQAHDEDGYFYFWIGSAHQGRGYGRRAARLLFEQAERGGVRNLFTSAYRSNWRSIEALAAMRFQPLLVKALAPDDDLLFFVRHESDRRLNGTVLRARLAALLSANDSPIVLAAADSEATVALHTGCV